MAITFPLTVPDLADVKNARMIMQSRVARPASTFTREDQAQVWPGQWWEIELTLRPMLRARAAPWIGFLAALNGMEGTFDFGDPSAAAPQGSAPGTPVVDGALNIGGTLGTRGWTVSQTGILTVGDYIQLGAGASKWLHIITEDANSDGAGDATLSIWPNLRQNPGDGATILTSNAQGTFRLVSNARAFDISTALHYGMTFVVTEDVVVTV